MAREHAAIRLDMWTDDEWRDLSIHAQHLYMFLLSSPSLSYAGVADWRAARIAGMTNGTTAADVMSAADELTKSLFVIYDDDTEEILVRSYLKHDGLLHKPNVAKAMITAFGKTVSPTLRGVIVHELVRLFEKNPEWKAFGLGEVQELLSRPSIDPKELLGEGYRKGSAKGSEFDPSLLTPNSLLLTPYTSHLTTSPNSVRDDVKHLCDLLVKLMTDNGDKAPTVTQGWLNAARLMLDKDGRELEASVRLMRWALSDSFWCGNIRSMPTFREKFDQLRHAANSKQESRKETPTDKTMAVLDIGRRLQAEHDRRELTA